MTTNYEKLDISEDLESRKHIKNDVQRRECQGAVVIHVACLCLMMLFMPYAIIVSLKDSCIGVQCHPFIIEESCGALCDGNLLMMIEGNCSSQLNTTATCYIDHINLFGNKEDPKIVGRLQCSPNYWTWVLPLLIILIWTQIALQLWIILMRQQRR